jgi:hypothetical protein
MLAHFGILAPVRALLKNFFDKHAASIMSLM